MHPEIAEINNRYEIMQDYFYPMGDAVRRIRTMSAEELQEHRRLANLYKLEYDILLKRVVEIIKTLEPIEVAEAYTEGCWLLQMNLCALMRRKFCDEYHRVMVDAIYAQHVHTSSIFLQILADNIGEKVIPLIEFALEREPMQKKALDIVAQLKLIEFRLQAERLLTSNNVIVKESAKLALDALK